jgi:hypothetical protein
VIVNRSKTVYVRQDPPAYVNGKLVTYDRSLQGGGQPSNLVLDSTRIAGKHLWGGTRLHFGSRFFCSQAFKDAFEEIDHGLRFMQVGGVQPAQPGDEF